MKRSHEARQRLLRLGIFRKVEVVIDTSQGILSLYLIQCILLWVGMGVLIEAALQNY